MAVQDDGVTSDFVWLPNNNNDNTFEYNALVNASCFKMLYTEVTFYYNKTTKTSGF